MKYLLIALLLISCTGSKILDTSHEEEHTEEISEPSVSVDTAMEDTNIDFLSFAQWLNDHPEYSDDLLREDLVGGSFGGVESVEDVIHHTPIVFVHGNSDRAYGGSLGGWKRLHEQFLEHGYTRAELYGTTYGTADSSDSSLYTHRKEFVVQVRQHIEAVLAYTGAEKIHVISHSLGVTIARQAILGGSGLRDDGTSFEIGESLEGSISVFVGIAGANRGLAQCYGSFSPVCSMINGLYPGMWNGIEVVGMSQVLNNLNADVHYEGERVYSIWSNSDQILGYQCQVWGFNSCRLPSQDGEASFEELDHFALRDETFDTIINWIAQH